MEFEKTHYRKFFFLATIAALLVAVASILVRPISPVNETLYSGVAWEMWSHHHILVPLVNGHTYNQKPPLFFWLTELGWKLFGVNNWWPILLPALCSLGSIYLTAATARKLFKSFPSIGILSALILLGMAYWAYYSPRVRLDQLLTLCTLLSLYGLVKSIRHERYGFLLLGIGNGLGLLTKGPICFIFTLVPCAIVPLVFKEFSQQKAKWFLLMLGSFVISVFIAGLWAAPIIIMNPIYAKSILWDQTVSRLLHNHHHVQIGVWYYYIIRIPLLIMPWLLWPVIWNGLRSTTFKSDATLRWLSYSMLIMFGILSFLISQKASRFLIPFFPFLAILLAYIILQTNYQCSIKFNRFISVLFIAGGSIVLLLQPVFRIFKPHSLMLSYYHGLWGLLPIAIGLLWWKVNSKNKINYAALIALSSCCITLLLYAIVIHMHTPDDDMHTVGTVIRQLQQTGAPVGFITTYDDRFNFAGRITQPLLYIQDLPNAARWGFQHPTGFIIQTVRKPAPKTFIPPFYQQSYRHKQVVQIWRGMDFALAHLKV